MERLSRSTSLATTIDEYAHQLSEQKIHSEQMDERRRQLNFLYDKLDRDTRTRYSRQYHDLEKRSNDLQDKIIEQTIRSEYLLRIWKEYQLRLEDIDRQLAEIENQLPSNKRLFAFQQIQSAFAIYKVIEKQKTFLIDDLLLFC